MRNGFKKRICLILAAMMIAVNVMPAMAEEIPGDVFEEELSEVLPDGVIGVTPEGLGMAMVMLAAEEEFSPAKSIKVCGATVSKGEYIYATPSEEDPDYVVLEVSSRHPVDEGGDELESGYAQYCKDGTLKLYEFDPSGMDFEEEDGEVFHNGIISKGDLKIHLSGYSAINLSSTDNPAIKCGSLTISGEDEDASLEISMGIDNESPVEAIYCKKDFLIQSNCQVSIENESEGPGIKCRNFVMEECEEVYLTITTSVDGIICDKFTLIPNGVACIEITAGTEDEYKFAGIRSNEIMIDCPNIPSNDNIIINAAGIGICSDSDVVIKSGNLTIGVVSSGPGKSTSGSDVGIGIKAEKQLVLGTNEDKSAEYPSLSITINTYEGGIEAGEVEIDSGDIEINVPDGKTEPEIDNANGIVADKITINGGDVTVYSTESALVLRDDTQKITIAEDLRIKAGSSADDLKDVEEYSGEKVIEIIDYCAHKDVILVEGKKPTFFEDGWKDYYKCNDCGWLYEDRECTVRIAYLAGWKKGRGKLPKLDPDPDPDPDPKPVPKPAATGYTAPVPVTTGSIETPVKDGTWKKLENGKWTFATNAPFKDTWGCIEYTKSNGEKTKGWFRFDKEGNMLVGYQEIDGKKYYFCEQEGDMYGMCQLGGTAPNGQKINEDGSLVE